MMQSSAEPPPSASVAVSSSNAGESLDGERSLMRGVGSGFSLLFGTVNGVIGIVASLTKRQYDVLVRVEAALNSVIKGVGGLRHDEWRSFLNERRKQPSKGFVDGDLVESFLDLDTDLAQEVVEAYNRNSSVATTGVAEFDGCLATLTAESLTKLVEELSSSQLRSQMLKVLDVSFAYEFEW